MQVLWAVYAAIRVEVSYGAMRAQFIRLPSLRCLIPRLHLPHYCDAGELSSTEWLIRWRDHAIKRTHLNRMQRIRIFSSAASRQFAIAVIGCGRSVFSSRAWYTVELPTGLNLNHGSRPVW